MDTNSTTSSDKPVEKTPEPQDKPEEPQVKRFLNGWTKELEVLFADWGDRAACYRWMHEKTGRMYHARDQGLMFPVIILSTIAGAANFAMNSISQNPSIQTYVQLGLGGLSITTGILTTIANRLGYASASEAHRGASISWGKFNRLIVIELALHPDERMDAFAFMKMFRIELDRLIEQSPSIPELIIRRFIYEFKEFTDVKKPDITGEIEHTSVFSDTNTRLKKIAEEAAITISQKKGLLKQLVLDDLDMKMRKMVREAIKNPLFEKKDKEKSASSSESPSASPNAFMPENSVLSVIASSVIPHVEEEHITLVVDEQLAGPTGPLHSV
jgi:hypothetical protein